MLSSLWRLTSSIDVRLANSLGCETLLLSLHGIHETLLIFVWRIVRALRGQRLKVEVVVEVAPEEVLRPSSRDSCRPKSRKDCFHFVATLASLPSCCFWSRYFGFCSY